jgi:hypothetical protein
VRTGLNDVTATSFVTDRDEGVNAIDGATSFTAIVIVALPDPPVFEAVTVYSAEPVSWVGVPVIEQSTVLNDSPEGSAWLTVQPVIAPPVLAGVRVAIALPIVPTSVLGLNDRTGATSFTVSVKLAWLVPPVFEAVTTYSVAA